ncbi:hypothetical protein EX30DRAFT_2221 [Ascodesmis nigricans]|uniref:Uncharacterized protein n=1 Tax=Ascodesmis nigricans TaxID=341454 RepID=A0A4S2N5I4_9PEZI|nr:hypothetical protein EX30DRAFT_2221 [Ascodesmis nigricans]
MSVLTLGSIGIAWDLVTVLGFVFELRWESSCGVGFGFGVWAVYCIVLHWFCTVSYRSYLDLTLEC